MIEREMEDLIASFASDFFPRRQLVLKGRQRSFSGVGRFDLLFEDEFQTNVLMELKARPGKYEDATQLARYKDELDRQGERNVLMWLVAPQIPNSVREFLDRIGIEYSEVHEAEFRRVAERHGVTSPFSESPAVGDLIPTKPTVIGTKANRQPRLEPRLSRVETGPTVAVPSPLRWASRGYDLVLVNREALDHTQFASLIQSFEDAVPSCRNARVIASLREWEAGNAGSALALSECQSLLRWVTTSGWKSAVPAAEAIWSHLFGRPAPTWQTWAGRRYEFDAGGWKRWYESLPH